MNTQHIDDNARATCLVVYGPQGCGKTTNAELIAAAFGKDRIYDDWTADDTRAIRVPNSLLLTHAAQEATTRGFQNVLSYGTAIRLAGISSVAFQGRVKPWLLATFGRAIAADQVERNHRFLEEAIELVQSKGCTASEAHQLVDYVYGRPIGDPPQEVGGVMVTLAALCLAAGIDMHAAADTELDRCWRNLEKIRAKQASKPKHSPLPAPPVGALPPWWGDFMTEIAELPDRNSPEDNPNALIATPDEMSACALSVINRGCD